MDRRHVDGFFDRGELDAEPLATNHEDENLDDAIPLANLFPQRACVGRGSIIGRDARSRFEPLGKRLLRFGGVGPRRVGARGLGSRLTR
jgi:hypothetical protein